MKILVVSDSHDHLGAVRAAVALATERKAAAIIHCGDLVSPIPLTELAAFEGPVHVTFGNNDAEQFLMVRNAPDRWPNVIFHKPFGDIELGGRRIAFEHYPELARGLSATGDYDIVFTGHTHQESTDVVGGTRLVNVGELMGFRGPRTAYTYDTETAELERHVIDALW